MEPVLQLGLRQALESGDCVLFIGAGIGCHLHSPDGEVAPDGTGLAKDLASHFSIDVGDAPDLAKVAQLVEIRKKGRSELITFLKRRLGDLEPDDTFAWIASRRWRAIFTTNYDDGIERAYARTANPPQTPVAISATAQLQQFDRRIQVPVYHLHGALVVGDDPRILITEDDYAHFS